VEGTRLAVTPDAAWYLLVELAGFVEPEVLQGRLSERIGPALDRGELRDAVLATSGRQRAELWRLRHHVTEGNVKEGMGLTHDIAVPLAAIGSYIERAGQWLARF